ncbi:hypothetical protein RIEGSTA812A_PEG_787 [invertebrate metagenome]|uniref:Uncharacterized protein n=1 Tax=invertebrate metagenome TaxID=1711999 RepID=A0A484H6T1_9ZZZZ
MLHRVVTATGYLGYSRNIKPLHTQLIMHCKKKQAEDWQRSTRVFRHPHTGLVNAQESSATKTILSLPSE